MKLQIEIELNASAFAEAGVIEVGRIVAGLVNRLPDPLALTRGEYTLLDANGNWCGYGRIVAGSIRRD